MATPTQQLAASDGYKWGALALFVASAVILTALGFEHLGGLAPCPLCLMQRWAYYAAIPALFAALVLASAGQRGLAATLFGLVALAFLANSGLALYHTGVELKYWDGPATCSGAELAPLSTSGQGVLAQLDNARVVRCDVAPWHFAGLSMAGWNIIVCLALMVMALKAAMASSERQKT